MHLSTMTCYHLRLTSLTHTVLQGIALNDRKSFTLHIIYISSCMIIQSWFNLDVCKPVESESLSVFPHCNDLCYSAEDEEEDDLMIAWFQLVNEKNDLVRKECDYIYM